MLWKKEKTKNLYGNYCAKTISGVDLSSINAIVIHTCADASKIENDGVAKI